MVTAVLMSTYNGELYLREQIDSILCQKDVNVRLYIRDDGSSDTTVRILKEYDELYENVIFVNKDQISHSGVRESYLSLLEYVYRTAAPDYYSFADQDDVWLPVKLAAGVKKLSLAADHDKGKLYYSNKTYVDKDLTLIKQENIIFYDDIYEVLWRNQASGCTMIFDGTLAGFLLKYRPEHPGFLHDNWTYRTAKAIGAAVIFDRNSYILYRQHERNVVGIVESEIYHKSTWYLIRKAVRVLFLPRNHDILHFVEEIFHKYNRDLPEYNRYVLGLFVRYRFSPVSKIRLILNQDMKKREYKLRLAWMHSVLFNRI